MAIENIKSGFLAGLDAQPLTDVTTGEGGPGMLRVLTDYVSVTASGMGSVGSNYRLARFPTYAKIKDLIIDLGAGIDTNAAATASFDINVAFSDSPILDGTPQALVGTIPTSALNGTVTTPAAYSTPNKLFGSLVAANAGAASFGNRVTFNGTLAGWQFNGREVPLWSFFNFVNAQGIPSDPGGFFDIFLRVGVVAATPAAGNIGVKLEYVV